MTYGGFEEIRGLVLDKTGSVLATGNAQNPRDAGAGIAMLTRKFSAAGAAESSIESIAIKGSSSGTDRGYAVALDPSQQRIVVVGSSLNPDLNRQDAVIWRYTTAGELDRNFANLGFAAFEDIAGNFFPSTPGYDLATCVVSDAQDRVIVGGWAASTDGIQHGFVGRLRADGVLDATFGTNGFVHFTPPTGGGVAEVNGLAIDSHGRIVAVGSQRDNTTPTSRPGASARTGSSTPPSATAASPR